jgi:sterol desaturase/sphingolipid hydroxylase (fatty acid hydroxylase superfamily)
MEEIVNPLTQLNPNLAILETGIEAYGTLMFNLIIGEVIFDLLTNKKRDYRQSAANYAISVMQNLISFIPAVYATEYLISLVYPFSFMKLEVNWGSTIAALVVADFIFYWTHRFSHRSKLFWGSHAVHHSSTDFDLTVTFRLGWIEMTIFYSLFYAPMSLMGFHPVQTLFASGFVLTYQLWAHTQKIGKLGILDYFLNTPSNHRVHHGSNPQYIDKNYGGVLILWDRLFGTYEPEREKVRYGITENIDSCNPITINLIEYQKIWSYLRKSKNMSEAFKSLFGPPEWKPQAVLEKKLLEEKLPSVDI